MVVIPGYIGFSFLLFCFLNLGQLVQCSTFNLNLLWLAGFCEVQKAIISKIKKNLKKEKKMKITVIRRVLLD